MQFYLSAIALGFALAGLGAGIFLSMKIFNIPDITTDGSFTLGAAITAVHISSGGHWLTAIILGMLAGGIAGSITGIIHAYLKVNALLSGILVMTALYSVNLIIMGRSNIPLIKVPHLFNISENNSGYGSDTIILASVAIVVVALLTWLLKTDYGLAMRATGNSEKMIRAFGVNTNVMKVAGLGLANAFTALSGALVAQFQQFADISMGIGIVIFGLGAVMIGEVITLSERFRSIGFKIIGVIIGCLIFRLIIAFTIASGADPNIMKLLTALVVLVFVSIPGLWKNKLIST